MYSGCVQISECALCVQTVWQDGREEGMVVASVYVPALMTLVTCAGMDD